MSYTVSELNNEIKTIITSLLNDNIIVTGEISNFKISNNNLFFTLKDEESAISALSWNYQKYIKNNISDIKNGDRVEVYGKLATYVKNGTYNLQIFKLEKIGFGGLNKKYEDNKLKYQNQGYFDDSRKKKMPNILNNIAIITALDGAALQDVLFVLKKNNFKSNIIVKNSFVQGNNCPESISNSIKYFNDFNLNTQDNSKKIDLILITRGGGSFEDLMGFSDSKIIEAIYNSNIFTISAIGHEIDNMLSDFVADLRAPTPSVAAEIISKINYNEVFLNKEKLLLDKINNTIDLLKLIRINKLNNLKLLLKEKTVLFEKIIINIKNKENILKLHFKNIINSKLNELILLKNKNAKTNYNLKKEYISKIIIVEYKMNNLFFKILDNKINYLNKIKSNLLNKNNISVYIKDKKTDNFILCASIGDITKYNYKSYKNKLKIIIDNQEIII